MFNLLASIQQECEQLGLEDDARVLRAWLSHSLPHLTEETEILEEIYDLYRSINTLPPTAIPTTTLSLRTVSYHTTGKSVHQIMGELGFLVHALYQHGYRSHDITQLPRHVRATHIQLGTLIQDLVVLFGIYYNSANKDDTSAAESEQMFSLWNTHIGSLVTKLAEALVRVKGYAQEMLASQGAKYFLEDNEHLRKQTIQFFFDIDKIILNIRKTFYQKNQLSLSDVAGVQELLKELHEFLSSLERLNSSLDLQSKTYSPQALMYWSVVFSKSHEAQKSGKQRRREITEDLSDKPFLRDYSVVLESSSKLFQNSAVEIQTAHKNFAAFLKTLINLNDKTLQVISGIKSFSRQIPPLIPALTGLEKAVAQTKAEAGNASPDLLIEKVKEKLATTRTVKEQKTLVSDLGSLSRALQKVYTKPFDIQGPNLLKTDISRIITELQSLATFLDKTMSELYQIWLGHFDDEKLNQLNVDAYRISQEFMKIAENPLGHLHDYEQDWIKILQAGKVVNDDGSLSRSFAEIAKPLLSTKYYESSEASQKEKLVDLANKVTDFNSLISALLSDQELPPEFDVTGLERFIEAINTEKRNDIIEKMEVEQDSSFQNLETLIAKLMPIADFSEWLKEVVLVKPSLDSIVGDSTPPVQASTNSIRLFAADISYMISIVRETATKEESGFLKIGYEVSTKKLSYRLFIKDGSRFIPTATPQVRDFVEPSDLIDQVSNVLRIYRAEPIESLETHAPKLLSWYESQLTTAATPEGESASNAQRALEEVKKVTLPPRSEELKRFTLDAPQKGEKEEDKAGRSSERTRLLTMQDYAVSLSPEVPLRRTNVEYLKYYEAQKKTIQAYNARLMDRVKQQFSHLIRTIEKSKNALLDSQGLLPAFPRIVYNTYAKTSLASQAWKDWKISKIEVPLSELETLIDNFTTVEELRAQTPVVSNENVRGIPLVTIDRIDDKFEDLKKLVRP
jgi:hypothetical protein